eukprot:TRINITY_DN122903_c0_g1_i1.p1 TRINITY_DN122903_c0_g1~~TRINITY_DN122903_c0_g1_i1.p1  ORF type:complete len:234 (+),score=21.72 TRINITY_DN122903_c0_g1_i1:60-761(+)
MDTWFTDPSLARRDRDEACTVELRVCGVGGELCRFSAVRTDPVNAVKEDVVVHTNVACQEQCLLHGDGELYDDMVLDAVLPRLSFVTLTLVRRTPEVSHWIHAVRQDGRQLRDAPVHIRADRGVVMCAVRSRGLALSYAADELKADRDIVIAAVAKNGLALEFAANVLKEDSSVVFTAVRQCGLSLEFAAASLRADPEVVLAAVREGGSSALRYAPEDLRADPAIFAAAAFGR